MSDIGTHTGREIHRQPEIWREVAEIVGSRRQEIDAFTGAVLGKAEARLILTGAGTSAFVGQVAAPALSRQLGRRVEAIATTDLVSDPHDLLVPDVPTLLVSFARSGDSPESEAATDLADQVLGHVRHLVITCNDAGRLAVEHTDRADSLVLTMPAAANDQGFAMTSSFTSMLLGVLLALGHADSGTVERLAVAAEALLADASDVSALAPRAGGRLVYLGSGSLLGLAHESALKSMELTAGRVVALGDSPMGFRHGPKAFLDPTTTVVVYLSNDPYTRAYDLDMVAELRAQLGDSQVVAVDGQGAGSTGAQPPRIGLHDVADVADPFLGVVAVLVAQLVGLEASTALGLTPDNPFPLGEVNRVVQGVHVHPLRSEDR